MNELIKRAFGAIPAPQPLKSKAKPCFLGQYVRGNDTMMSSWGTWCIATQMIVSVLQSERGSIATTKKKNGELHKMKGSRRKTKGF